MKQLISTMIISFIIASFSGGALAINYVKPVIEHNNIEMARMSFDSDAKDKQREAFRAQYKAYVQENASIGFVPGSSKDAQQFYSKNKYVIQRHS